MTFSLIGFPTLVQRMLAAAQGRASVTLDSTEGSVLRSIIEAGAGMGVWFQWQILQAMQAARASTSSGSDLDKWMADFGFQRQSATPASGVATFSRASAGIQALISPGTLVRTGDGLHSYTVTADPSHICWSSSGQYVIAPLSLSIDLPLVSTSTGYSGNVSANSITLISTPICGMDYVINSLPMTGGSDGETDDAYRSRFIPWINSRSLGTPLAIRSAVEAVTGGIRFAILDGVDASLGAAPSSFVVVCDGGSPSAPPLLLQAVANAIDAVRPIGSRYSVIMAEEVGISLVLRLTISPQGNQSAIKAEFERACVNWINGIPIGGSIQISRLIAIAHATDGSVVSVTSATINGRAADLSANSNQVFQLQSVVVN